MYLERGKWFRWLWRCNALLIFAVGLLAVALLGYVSYEFYQDSRSTRNTADIVNLAADEAIDESWRLGQFEKLSGQDQLLVPLYSDQNYRQSYYGKSTLSTRNLLFIDSNSLTKRWLFKEHNYLIERHSPLSYSAPSGTGPVVAMLYQVVKQDSNQDQRLSAEDLSNLSISRPDGSGYRQLVGNIESLIDYQLLAEQQLLVLYKQQGQSYLAKFALASGERLKWSSLDH